MKLLHLLILFIVLSIIGYCSNANADDCYSSGIRVGTIQKFSQKGLVNKSWEGELVMEGTKISGSSGSIKGGNVWKFSATDKNVADKIDEVTMSGKSVALKYCELNPITNLKVIKFKTETNYIVIKAEVRSGN